jgi:hypothetical protein
MIHAFMRRTWFTCFDCASSEPDQTYCAYNRCPIRWDPTAFGCGNYCTGDNEGKPRQMKLEAFR